MAVSGFSQPFGLDGRRQALRHRAPILLAEGHPAPCLRQRRGKEAVRALPQAGRRADPAFFAQARRGPAAARWKDKPTILGLIQHGGQVILHMLANVRAAAIKPVITAAVALVHTGQLPFFNSCVTR